MAESTTYLCPGCGAYLRYDGKQDLWVCDYCDQSYTKDALQQRGAQTADATKPQEKKETVTYDYQENIAQGEQNEDLQAYHCPNCGAEIVTDGVTAATFCVFCQNPTIIPQKFEGKYRPSAMIPFKTDKKQAQEAFLRLCKGKKLLPKGFASQQRLEKITGVYVPYWLFDCKADFDYHATGEDVMTWSDGDYRYTKTDTYHLHRNGMMEFENIPLDASANMEDNLMDALEPFSFDAVQPFDLRYLSGYLAEKYTYEPKELFTRMQERVSEGIENRAQAEGRQYDHVHSVQCNTAFQSDKQQYLLLPVWMLISSFKGKKYLFAMNGQTGKIVGELPCDKGKMVQWFFIIFLIVLAVLEILIAVIM